MNIYINRITNKVRNIDNATSQANLTYIITVPEDFETSKTIQIQDGKVQKVNSNGELLYYVLKEVTTESESYLQPIKEETTESRTITKMEQREVINKWTDDKGIEQSKTVIVDVPVEWVENQKIIIPNMVDKYITFKDSPQEFTVDEIIETKFKNLLEQSNDDHILADMFLNEDDIDLSDSKHSANTGVALMQLLGKGQAKTKTIKLDVPAKSFKLLEFISDDGVDIYLDDTKFVDGKVDLDTVISDCTIKFVNTTDKFKVVNSYAIGY